MFTVGFHDLLYHYLNPLIYTLSDFVVSGRMTASYFGTYRLSSMTACSSVCIFVFGTV
ncbi:hypothetical protein AC239_03500 [Bacteroides fragilis]|nr:hypothetical protein AC141_01130 [Bacteroides fragilis]OCR44390.1 hypothetical protein AC239_03500 [Bacteroides fragilis]